MGLKKKTRSVVLKLSVSEKLFQQYRDVRSMADKLGHEYDIEEDLARVLDLALQQLQTLEQQQAEPIDQFQQ